MICIFVIIFFTIGKFQQSYHLFSVSEDYLIVNECEDYFCKPKNVFMNLDGKVVSGEFTQLSKSLEDVMILKNGIQLIIVDKENPNNVLHTFNSTDVVVYRDYIVVGDYVIDLKGNLLGKMEFNMFDDFNVPGYEVLNLDYSDRSYSSLFFSNGYATFNYSQVKYILSEDDLTVLEVDYDLFWS